MHITDRPKRVRGRPSAIALCGAAVLLGACGNEEDYANEPRPPSPIVVSTSINDERIAVSPESFGAGPITLIVTNQTSSAHEVTLETDEIAGNSPGIKQESGPINPGDTASLKADLEPGTYSVGVSNGAIEPATLEVGDARPSAQDKLLQP